MLNLEEKDIEQQQEFKLELHIKDSALEFTG